jgi:hypothetical protein
MKKALISPNEKVFDPNTNVELGERVAEVAQADFAIALPLFWVDCADDVVADLFYYDPSSGNILPIPMPPEPAQPVSSGAQTL